MRGESKTEKFPKKLGLWLRQIVTWVNVGLMNVLPYIPIIAVAFAIVCIDTWAMYYKEVGIRYIGMSFQVIGFILVLQQLEGRLKIFRRPSVWSSISSYLRSFPSSKSKIHRVSASSISAKLAGYGSARARLIPSPNSSLKKRLKILEDDMENIRKDVTTMEETLSEYKSGNEESIEEMRQESTNRFEKLEAIMDETLVGSIPLERVGIWYFLVGVVLATAAPELSV